MKRRPMSRSLATLLLALLLCAAPRPASGAVKESWYMMRGRANMEIGNYKAAIEAYEKVVETNPKNREAMKSLGEAYEKNGLTDKAIAQYDRYLTRFPDDTEVAFAQAERLGWSRYAYRRNDALKYYRLGLGKKDDREARIKFARLLAQEKKDLPEALKEYRRIVQANPKDAATRAEYRKLLLWDERFRKDAIAEWQIVVAENPEDHEAKQQLARMLAKEPKGKPEATRMYAELVAARPKDAALRLEYAKLLSSDRARRKDAIAELRTIADEEGNVEARIAWADLVSEEPARRPEALAEYEKVLERQPENRAVRLKRARLLGAEKETTPAAIREYEKVLASKGDDAEAHEGLARGHAWLGDRDKAALHADLAARSRKNDPQLAALRTEMLAGREPHAGATAGGIWQPGEAYGLRGVRGSVKGRAWPVHFATVGAEIGAEELRTKGDAASGGFGRGEVQIRFGTESRFDAEAGYHAAGLPGQGFVFRFAHERRYGEDVFVRSSLSRQRREDSFLAIVGTETIDETGAAVEAGAARANLADIALEMRRDRLLLSARPFGGWITAVGARANLHAGVDAQAGWRVMERDGAIASLSFRSEVSAYERDHSGFVVQDAAPFVGGYFSPKLHARQGPRVDVRLMRESRWEILASGGPGAQYHRDTADPGGVWQLAADADLEYVRYLSYGLVWSVRGSYTRVGEIYDRVRGETVLRKVF